MKTTLNSKLWKDNKLKPEVREAMLKIGNHFYNYLGVEVPLLDIVFVGSLANYNWHYSSDVDIHIIIDYSKISGGDFDTITQLLLAKKTIFNNKMNITIKGYDVELFPEDIQSPSKSSGKFSLIRNTWILKPRPQATKIDTDYLKISKIYQELIDDTLKLSNENPLKLKLAQNIKFDIHQKRLEGLKDGNEYSRGNLLYKKLRKDDFYGLFNAIAHAQDKQLSLERFNR